MRRKRREASAEEARMDSNRRGFGCCLILMGLVAAVFGVAALFGVSPVSTPIELEFFEIDMNSRSGRIWWVLGSLATIGVGVFLFRSDKRGA